MSFTPYLHFEGTCAEAMAFYADLFRTAPPVISRFCDNPEAVPDWKDSDRVMHSFIDLKGQMLMASDFPPGFGDKQAAVSVMHHAADIAEARRIYDALLDSGDVIMPFGPGPTSPGFGMVRDRFGTHWMIAAPSA